MRAQDGLHLIGVGGVNYSEWGQAQLYDTTMYEIQRSRKRRRDVEEGPFNVEKRKLIF
jgi:hypothetical protein